MKTATHFGTCQICGRAQKLPGGKLSKHGYTVQWGFFSGTCPGSDHLPFELSIDLIERFRNNAAEAAVEFRAEAAAHLAGEGDVVMARDLKSPRGERYSRIESVTLSLVTHTVNDYSYKTVVGHWADGSECGTNFYSKNVRETEQKLRATEAARLIKQAAQREEYVEWQDARVKGWKPSSLKAVNPEAEKTAKDVIKVGTVVRIGGKTGSDVTVVAIEYKQAWGVGPHLNGQTVQHIGYEGSNGKRYWYPLRLIRKTAIVKA